MRIRKVVRYCKFLCVYELFLCLKHFLGILKRHPETGDRPRKVLSNPHKSSIEPLKRYRTPFWPPKRFYRTPVRGCSEPQKGSIEPFASNPPFSGYPFKTFPMKDFPTEHESAYCTELRDMCKKRFSAIPSLIAPLVRVTQVSGFQWSFRPKRGCRRIVEFLSHSCRKLFRIVRAVSSPAKQRVPTLSGFVGQICRELSEPCRKLSEPVHGQVFWGTLCAHADECARLDWAGRRVSMNVSREVGQQDPRMVEVVLASC